MRIFLFAMVCGLGAAATTARADRLVDTREVARGAYLSLQFSPDGRDLLVTGPQLRGLQLVPIAGGAPRTLSEDAEAGVHARWLADGTVAFRAASAGTRRDLVATRAGQVRAAAAPAQRPIAFAQDGRIYAERAGKLVEISSGDQFFGGVVSPDGDKVVFQGLVTGLHVYTRSTGAVVSIGPGTAPAWSPDSRRLVFEVTEDDGHDISASELYLYDLAADRASPLTTSERVIERRPSFSPDGARVAFDDNTGGLFVGKVAP
jgi:dipeptidyl aminopeptidase/acylaminoacyl peptidase